MANILMGLSGLFGGAAQGYNEAQDRQMRQILFNAQLAMMGGGRTPSAPGSIPASVGNAATLSPSDNASLSAAVAPPPDPMSAPSGAPPQAPPPPTPSLPPAGQVSALQGGSVPTTAGGVAQQMRAINDAQPPHTPPPAGNDLLSTLHQASAQLPGTAPQGAAPAIVPSGVPMPGTAPTGVDPFGGANSGLTSIIDQYQKSLPHGSVDLGHGYSMDLSQTPQALEGQRGLLKILAEAQEQQNLFGQQSKLEGTRESFEGGQTDKQIAAGAALAGNTLAEQKREHDLEARQRAEQFGVEMKRLDQELNQQGIGNAMRGGTQFMNAVKPVDGAMDQYRNFATAIDQLRGDAASGRKPNPTALAAAGTAFAALTEGSPRISRFVMAQARQGQDMSWLGRAANDISKGISGSFTPQTLNAMDQAARAVGQEKVDSFNQQRDAVQRFLPKNVQGLLPSASEHYTDIVGRLAPQPSDFPRNAQGYSQYLAATKTWQTKTQ